MSLCRTMEEWMSPGEIYNTVYTIYCNMLSTSGVDDIMCALNMFTLFRSTQSEIGATFFFSYRIFGVGYKLLPLPQPADHWFRISLGRAAQQCAASFLCLHILRWR